VVPILVSACLGLLAVAGDGGFDVHGGDGEAVVVEDGDEFAGVGVQFGLQHGF